ncbi:proteasome inhibitor pi31 subunit [Anaeramoeba flamelloides]|uniref:Proteasome inhibitor pi31 subunit n=1 Tax=Anaeramoeba flamelloides TaxID=1746091 RepID=A0AAV7ZMV3_9EUKA|nr:proteasome inhibitor pi31 subunit [Anaeramoeba flamelloides]
MDRLNTILSFCKKTVRENKFEHDLLVLFLHNFFTSEVGMELIRVGENGEPDGFLNLWNKYPDSYSFLYKLEKEEETEKETKKKKEKENQDEKEKESKSLLLKCLIMENTLIVHFRSISGKLNTLELPSKDFVKSIDIKKFNAKTGYRDLDSLRMIITTGLYVKTKEMKKQEMEKRKQQEQEKQRRVEQQKKFEQERRKRIEQQNNRDPLRVNRPRFDPFSSQQPYGIGSEDLNPFGGMGGMGGMGGLGGGFGSGSGGSYFGPNHPTFTGGGSNSNTDIYGLPKMGRKPKIKFDPFGPLNKNGKINPDHLKKPDSDDDDNFL